jgi:CAAX protease family protein
VLQLRRNVIRVRCAEEQNLTMKQLFIRDGRLRSGWRLASFIVVSQLLQLVLSIPIGIVIGAYFVAQGIAPTELGAYLTALVTDFTRVPALFFASELVVLIVTLGVVYVWRHRLDKQSFRSLGFQLTSGWWQEFLLGAGIIAITWLVIFAFALVTTTVSIQATRFNVAALLGGLGLGLAYNLLVGLTEELDARGYVLQTLAEGVKFAPAVILSALYFGVRHLLNPGADWASALGTGLFGVLAALAYWSTGRLWMPIGMHAAWNLFEGPVFGFLVSGIHMGGLFVLRVNGPAWLTGGSFGPEAGALTIVPQLVLIVIVYLWGRARRRQTRTLA